jgi:hypothetical protein
VNRRFSIGILLIFLLIATTAIWLLNKDQKIENVHAIYSTDKWDTTYNHKDKGPYGTSLFNSLLLYYFDKKEPFQRIENYYQLDSIASKPSTFIYIGESFYLSESETNNILRKIQDGSDLMIACNKDYDFIKSQFFDKLSYSFDYSNEVTIYHVKDQLKTKHAYVYQRDTIAKDWKGFDKYISNKSKVSELAYIYGMPCFLTLKYGEGQIFLITNPELFLNFSVKEKSGFQFASYVISFLKKNKPLVFLDLAIPADERSKPNQLEKNYLQLIISHPGLYIAFLLMLIGFIISLAFSSKRFQPKIPIIIERENKSLQFADTIASLFQKQSNPFYLLRIQRKNFYVAVYKKFYIDLHNTTGENRKKQIAMLSEKSGVEAEKIEELLKLLECNIEALITQRYIYKVAILQREFYSKCGFITHRIEKDINKKQIKIYRELLSTAVVMLLGTLTLLLGLFQLTQSSDLGMLTIITGFLFLMYGFLRLNKPLIKFSDHTIIYYPLLGMSQKINFADITFVNRSKFYYTFHTKSNAQLKIAVIQLNNPDKKQLEKIINAHFLIKNL